MNELTQDELINRLEMATVIIADKFRQKMVALRYVIDADEAPVITALQTGETPWDAEWIKDKKIHEDAFLIDELLLCELNEHIPRELFEPIAKLLSALFRKQESGEGTSVLDDDVGQNSIVTLWLLRTLVVLGGHKSFIKSSGFRHDGLAEKLKVSFLEKESPFDQDKALELLQQQHQTAEDDPVMQDDAQQYPAVFDHNRHQLQTMLGLNDVELEILSFAILLCADSLLEEATNYLDSLSTNKLHQTLATLLAQEETSIKHALSPDGILHRSGLLKVDQGSSTRMRSKLNLISSSVYDQMTDSSFQPINLLKDKLAISPTAKLTLDDYPYLDKDIKILQAYLANAIQNKQSGCNILIYGVSGTGKTELVRTIATALSITCFEVSHIDHDKDAISIQQRLDACASAQILLADMNCLLMFDAIEGVLLGDEYHQNSVAHARKAWFNQLLEENKTPTIWISGISDRIDPAFIRRFDLVVEVPIPNAKHRERLLNHYDPENLLSTTAKHRFAQHQHLSPAIIARSLKALKPLVDSIPLSPQQTDDTFEQIVNQSLRLQQHKPLLKAGEMVLPNHYSPRYLNTGEDMAALAETLKQCTSARLCLYGPPGTGKTAFGHFLSQELDKPLIIKRASDFLSKWMGETEANIAKAFSEAQNQHAILMIDEIDSFVSKRDNTQHTWEVSTINEVLTQMETFSGIFIASTNRIEGLDPAAMRRFDLKIKADYLNDQQKQALFSDTCAQLGLEPDALNVKHLSYLTPGDFAVIMRQHQFRPLKDAQTLISALEKEVELKGEGKRIGF